MTPNQPLSWIASITRGRDEGSYHLESTQVVEVVSFFKDSTPLSLVRAACGARPFAYGGSFPDGADHPSPGIRCQKCEAMAAKLRLPAEPTLCACPECGHRVPLFDRSQMVAPATTPCPRCGRFRLEEFATVPA